jgi:hypothetical protein
MAIVSTPVYKTSNGNLDYSKYIPGLELRYKQILQMISNATGGGGSNPSMLSAADAQRARFIEYINNPNSEKSLAYEKSLFDSSVHNYGYYASVGNTTEADKYKQEIQKQTPYLVNFRNIPVKDIQTEIDTNLNEGVESAKRAIAEEKKQAEGSWFDKALGLVAAVGIGALTAGLGTAIAAELGISAIAGNAIAGTLVGVAQGQDPATALRNGIASAGGAVAGEEILKGMKGFTDPAVANMFANSVKYGTEAALKGQDIVRALEAGAAGGAVSSASTVITNNSTTMSVQDQKDISKALGTFTAAKAQGLSTEQALASATAGFAASEVGQARDAILKDAPAQTRDQAGGQNQGNISNAGNFSQGEVRPSTSISDNKVLPPIEVTADPSLYDPALLSDYQVTKQAGSQQFPVTKKFQNNVLLGYINQTPGLPGVKNFGYNPQSASQNISQAASAQALQTGSPDSPFQDPKEGGKRKNVWNQASLRTMDETGSTA